LLDTNSFATIKEFDLRTGIHSLKFVSAENFKSETVESDESLVERAKQGSDEAFEDLVRRYMHKAHAIARQYVKNSEDARDLAQDTFVKIYQSLHTFNPKYRFYSWFYRILMNHCLNFQRRKTLISFISIHPDVFSRRDEYAHASTTMEDGSLDSTAVKKAVNNAIKKLPVKQREVILLCDIEGLPQNEAAHILQIKEGTLRSRLHYGRLRLRDALQEFLIH